MADRISRLELSRLVAGDLSPEQERQLRTRLDSDPQARRELAEIEEQAAAFAERAPQQWAALARRLQTESAPAGRPRRWTLLVWPGALATAAAALLLILLWPGAGTVPETAFKGGVAVRLLVKRGEQQFAWQPGQELAPGDAVRFLVTTPVPGYLSLFSVDGRGQVSPLYPEKSASAEPEPQQLPRAGQQLLPGSAILDEAAGPERFVVVFSANRFRRDRIEPPLIERLIATGSVSAAELGLGGVVEVLSVPKRSPSP